MALWHLVGILLAASCSFMKFYFQALVSEMNERREEHRVHRRREFQIPQM